MKSLRARTDKSLYQTVAPCNRREADRMPVDFGLMYSAQDAKGDLIMGDGVATNLSQKGLGIRGDATVTPGTELTLFLYLPDGRDPLFVMEARVMWAAGHHFGVRLLKMNVRELNRLHSFLRANSPL
ncbi:MAG TPA: PilZ domain-containing protein [Nitrospiraceae bacterium]|nr:PilZ domain-containing protein [Nitrospiraceae bacterium]